MGRQTEYLKGKYTEKESILKYLRKRRDYINNMMIKRYEKMHEVNCCELEVVSTYNALISDIKNDKLD